MYPLKLRAGICAVCGGPIYVHIADPRHADGEPTVQRKFQAAVADHFATHPALMQAGSRLRDAQPNERLSVLRQVYVELLAAWGDQDRRATYTIDEALGSAAAYRLWLDGHLHERLSGRNRTRG